MKFLKTTNLISALLVLTTFSSVSFAETEAEAELRLYQAKLNQCQQMIEDNHPDAAEFCASIKIRIPTIRPSFNDL